MVGGEADAFAVAEPILSIRKSCHAHGRCRSGPARWSTRLHRRTGAGSVEGSTSLRERVSTWSVLEVIGKGAAQSGKWTIAAKRWRPTSSISALQSTGCAGSVDLSRGGRNNSAALPVNAIVDQFYARIPGARRRALGHVEPDSPLRDGRHEPNLGERAEEAAPISRPQALRKDRWRFRR
jgi:hypothetical protein